MGARTRGLELSFSGEVPMLIGVLRESPCTSTPACDGQGAQRPSACSAPRGLTPDPCPAGPASWWPSPTPASTGPWASACSPRGTAATGLCAHRCCACDEVTHTAWPCHSA